ncbi:MAG: hypothetical protein WCH11_03370 [Bdellovibrio sp.]
MKPQSGQITIEFLFSLILALGMFSLLFAISFTLTMVEITQYVVFSSTRAMIAANLDPETQTEVARQKYEQLVGRPSSPAHSLFNGSWFRLSSSRELDIRTGVNRDFSSDLAGGRDSKNIFTGVSTLLSSQLLNINIPFLGSTSGGDDNAFSTRVNTILIREPSQKECFTWYSERAQALLEVPSSRGFYKPDQLLRMEDNGC